MSTIRGDNNVNFITRIICIILICMLALRKTNKAYENYQRCPQDKVYVENVEEIIRKEKAVKIIRYIICYGFLTILALFMVLPFIG